MKFIKTENLSRIVYVIVLSLMILSLAIVYSASVRYSEVIGPKNDSHDLAMKHVVKTLFAAGVLVAVSKLPMRFWKDNTHIFMLLSIASLILVLFIGESKKGATRSIDLKMFELQPSFVALYAMILHLSRLIEKKGERIKNLKSGYLPMLMWIGLIAFLVFLQPNFSQGMVIIFVGLSLMFLGGAQLKHLFSTVAASLPFLIIYLFSADYRYQRIMTFMQRIFSDSLTDPDPQIRYSIYAIGSGGLYGVGMGNSRFRELFIPESYGDFIFAIVGEEFGFIGSLVIISLYLLIFVVGLLIIRKLSDDFSKLLVAGIIITLMFYTFANVLVVVGVLPTTGLPLPFLSYGGSATVMHSFGIGLLINVASNLKSEQTQSDYVKFSIERV
jgi:cell division protein FtsW